jgi:hypothetical protein
VSSSPQEGSVSSNRYRKVKRSIISSYFGKNEKYDNKGRKHQQIDEEDDKENPSRDTRNGTRRDKHDRKKEERDGLPNIKEIKKTYGDNKPNIATLENYEDAKDEDDQKRELLFKIHRLKKTYPRVNLPEFNMMSNHDNMKKTYDTTIKNLAIDSTVETYKSYLLWGFMGCEIVLGKIGFDMEGYTQQQTLCMNRYEKLLVELGEKSYIPSSINKWPVEIRLMALILFQTTLFILSKIIARKYNVNILQMYNNVNGNYEAQTRSTGMGGMGGGGSSSGFGSGGSSPLTFIPKKRTPSTHSNSESRMKGPSATKSSDG